MLKELRTQTSWFTSWLGTFKVIVRYSLSWFKSREYYTLLFSQYMQVWSLGRWRYLHTVQRREQLIWIAEGREKLPNTTKFTTAVYLKNMIIWRRYCVPMYTESTSFCEHNFGNQDYNLEILAEFGRISSTASSMICYYQENNPPWSRDVPCPAQSLLQRIISKKLLALLFNWKISLPCLSVEKNYLSTTEKSSNLFLTFHVKWFAPYAAELWSEW